MGVAAIALLLLAATAVRVFGLGDPLTQHLDQALQSPSLAHPFGTDNVGRDLLSRTLYATWTDVALGVSATVVSVLLGALVGTVAGLRGGFADSALMRTTDALIAFPFLILSLAIIAVAGPGSLVGLFLALVVKGWPQYARIARAETLVEREHGYVLAARTLGLRRSRVLFRHVLPNVMRPCWVFSFSDLIVNILLIATLSYLGLGIQPPAPEWGAIIAEGQTYILSAWWITTLPGLVVVYFGVAVALVGDVFAHRRPGAAGEGAT